MNRELMTGRMSIAWYVEWKRDISFWSLKLLNFTLIKHGICGKRAPNSSFIAHELLITSIENNDELVKWDD